MTRRAAKKKREPRARAEVRQLVDALPVTELAAAKRYLEYLRDAGDPLMRILNAAPYDDEPTTPEEDASAKRAWQQRHQSISSGELKRKYL